MTATKRQTPVSVPETPEDIAIGWEAAGRRIAPMLGSYSSAVITSSDELAAAHVAIGIGRAEAEHRRVAIGDLVGEVDPIQSLVRGDDPHGISDSFTYGVSLNKIAQPVDATGNLFVMPSGTGSVTDSEIFRNARWHRLANGFREVGALLLLVAPANVPGMQELIKQTDGVVLVGKSLLDFTPYLNVLARVPEPAPIRVSKSPKQRMPLWRLVTYLIILAVLLGTGMYMRYLNVQNSKIANAEARKAAAAAAGRSIPRPVDTLTIPPLANPADSLNAAAYAVEIEAWNMQEDAKIKLQHYHEMLPAATISSVPLGAGREVYYKLIAGAFGSRRTAEALLRRLRQKQVVRDVPGTVVRTPYALLLDSAVAGHTESLVQKYVDIGQPVYVLVQPDGTLKLYAGAFERPEYSATLLMTLRAAKLNPILVYRTGRSP